MRIFWAASEAVPYAKTGGLADVSGALPAALAARGHDVTVVMPYYPQVMKPSMIGSLKALPIALGVPMGSGGEEWAEVIEDRISPSLRFLFIRHDRYFDRPTLYDWHGEEYDDNAERFIFLSRAVMQLALALNEKIDILHANDWHTALCPVYMRSALYRDNPVFRSCYSILSLHNVGYQGVFHKHNLFLTGLGWEYFNFHCLEYYDQLNLLKGGVMTADMVNTVSPTYAVEILSPEFSFGLDHVLRSRAATGCLRGILNGIDADEWNPETDPLIPANYAVDKMGGKSQCRRALLRRFGLAPAKADVPVFGTVSRLAGQKGIDVLAAALDGPLDDVDFRMIVVGSGDPWLRGWLDYLAATRPGRIGVYIGYDEELAHCVEAGSDVFVMPSRYEPCGLNQMYSMRYGTLPLVRATGGLDDTVTNYDAANPEESTGFKFYDLTVDALAGTMRWAASVFAAEPKHVKMMRRSAMARDYSWNHTAADYERFYDDARKRL